MKAYKLFRWVLKASALSTIMFIMQACYGSPNMPPDREDEMEMTENDSIQSPAEELIDSTNVVIDQDGY